MRLNPSTLPTKIYTPICQAPSSIFTQVIPLFAGHAVDKVTSPRFHINNAHRPDKPACYFHYCLSGAGIFRDRGREHEIGARRAILFRSPSDTEYWLPEGAHWERLFISFRGDVSTFIVENLLQQHGPIYEYPVDSRLIQLLTEIVAASFHAKRPSFFEATGKLYQFLMLLCEAHLMDSNDYPEPVHRALKFLETDYTNPDLQVEDLARKAGLSKYYFSRLFQRHTGKSPAIAIRDRRIETGLSLLAYTHLPLKEIALQIGYRDYRNFHRCCIARSGKTPGQIRQDGIVD